MGETKLNLTGSMLIAMPQMQDERFAQSVVFMCDHSEKGAMGLIVNKPATDIGFPDLLEQLEIERSDAVGNVDVMVGGPVETGRGFVLHSTDFKSDLRTMKVMKGVSLTPTLDVLEEIAAGRGPRDALMLLGYAGWGPGQLEGELARNGWLTCDANADLVFQIPAAEKWSTALRELGVDPAALSGQAGFA